MTATEPIRREALKTSAAALRRLATYTLPPELDKRVLELGERKETLTAQERAELLAWVAFTQERTVEKWQAELALRRLTEGFPELTESP